jgi:hypothetical protein
MRGEEQVSPTTTPPAEDIKYIPALAMLLNSVFNAETPVEVRTTAAAADIALNIDGNLNRWEPNPMPKKYRKAIDTKKLEKLLGVFERYEIKMRLFAYRHSLEQYLKSGYCQDGFKIYIANEEAGASAVGVSIFEGQRLLNSLLALLAVYPEDKDRFLTLPQHVRKEGDNSSVKVLLREIDNGGAYPAYTDLLTHELDLDYMANDFCYNNGFGGVLTRRFARENDGLSLAVAVRDIINGTIEQLVRLNYTDFKPENRFRLTTDNGRNILEVRKSEFKNFSINKFGEVRHPDNLTTNKRGYYRIVLDDEQAKLFQKQGVYRFNNHRNPNLEIFFNSGGFKGALAGLELISLIIKINKYKGSDNLLENFSNRDTYDIIGSGFMLAHYSMEWRIAVISALKDTKFAIGSRFLGYAGAAIGVGLAVWDMFNLFADGDDDAAWASAGLAVLNVGLLVSLLPCVATGVGAVAAIILIALIFITTMLVSLLTDDSMESFLKNNIIGSNVECPPGNLRPAEYMRLLYDRRAAHAAEVNERFEPYFDPWQAIVNMHDFLPTFSSELLLVDLDAQKYRLVGDENLIIQSPTIGYSATLNNDFDGYIPRHVLVRTRCNHFVPGQSLLDFKMRFGNDPAYVIPYIAPDAYEKIKHLVDPEGAEISEIIQGMRFVIHNGIYYIDTFYSLTDKMIRTIKKVKGARRNLHFEARLLVNADAESEFEKRCWPMAIDGQARYMVHEFQPYTYSLQGKLWRRGPQTSKIVNAQM